MPPWGANAWKHARFFEGVGAGDTAGSGKGDPNIRPDFRAANLKKLEKQKRAAKAQEMI